MVGIAQLARASGCGPEGRGFEPHYSPQKRKKGTKRCLFCVSGVSNGAIALAERVQRAAVCPSAKRWAVSKSACGFTFGSEPHSTTPSFFEGKSTGAFLRFRGESISYTDLQNAAVRIHWKHVEITLRHDACTSLFFRTSGRSVFFL